MTLDVQSSEYIANFNTKKKLNIENISGNSLKDEVRATPMTNLVCILLGISPASDCGLPTFRNPLSVPSSRAGCKV